MLLAFKGAADMGDYDYAITDARPRTGQAVLGRMHLFRGGPGLAEGLSRGDGRPEHRQAEATEDDLKEAFSDLLINEKMLDQLGPAINSGRGMFLFGEPGNGKTSIAERITNASASTIWIPRALGIDGDIIRVVRPRRPRGDSKTLANEHCSISPASTRAGCRSCGRPSSPAAN